MNEAMSAEFDTVAGWTAEAALALGPDYFIPAGCRGSAQPGALRWLLDRLEPEVGHRFLDCGAGVGGPAGFLAAETGVRPVLTDPEPGACRAADRLFGFPTAQAAGPLPFGSAVFDRAWSLGVLCTVSDQPAFLAELRRVLRPAGRLGLLVFAARSDPLPEQPEGNHFPAEDELDRLIAGAGFRIVDSASVGDFAGSPTGWVERSREIETELERRHGTDPAWLTAADQSTVIGQLLSDGDLVGRLFVARPV